MPSIWRSVYKNSQTNVYDRQKLLTFFSCGCEENGKEEQALLALFGNFNLDFPSRFIYSDVKEVCDSGFVLCFAKF